MSSSTGTSTHRLILLVLCLSLYACDARRLGASHKKPQNKLHQTNKSSKEMGSDQYHETPLAPKMKNFSLKPSLEVTKGESAEATHQKHHNSTPTKQPPKHTNADDDLSFGTTRKTKRSSTAEGGVKNDKSSFVSVSWRVPRKKRGIQKQPGFNLDYSPPKTHPPSHN